MEEVSRSPIKNHHGTFQQLREIVVDNHVGNGQGSRNPESRHKTMTIHVDLDDIEKLLPETDEYGFKMATICPEDQQPRKSRKRLGRFQAPKKRNSNTSVISAISLAVPKGKGASQFDTVSRYSRRIDTHADGEQISGRLKAPPPKEDLQPLRIASRQETFDAILGDAELSNAKVWRDSIVTYTPLGQAKRETLTPEMMDSLLKFKAWLQSTRQGQQKLILNE